MAYDYLSKEGDNPLYTAHEYIENIDDEVFKHLLRPFTKKRADHVRELNNFTRKDEVSV
ncbi:hypothetical protein H8D85_00070 [bacterium]|nr:hypothetical protein [bacterium]